MASTFISTDTVAGRFLAEVAQAGKDPAGGWSRLAFSAEEREAHEIFARWSAELGLDVHTDAVGNTYADWPGTEREDAILVGSHLDTVPGGGTFDGAAGVAASIEAAHHLVDSGQRLRRTLRLVAFAAEEGARFGVPCIGSRCAIGEYGASDLAAITDADGRSAADCAREVGLCPEDLGEDVWEDGRAAAFLELHIEQGRVLEDRGIPLGVVNSIAGSTRVEVRFTGRADHTGATPMWLRSDALAAAAEFVLEAERSATARATAVATVGRLKVAPGSLTTIPGWASLGLDARDLDSERQRELVETLLDAAVTIAQRRGLQVEADLLSDQSPVLLHETMMETMVEAAADCDIEYFLMPSGASHDAGHIARKVPTGMLFVPSHEGISHSPEEWTEPESVSAGARVLTRTIRRLDEKDVI